MANYLQKQAVQSTAIFTTVATNVQVDPTTVTFAFQVTWDAVTSPTTTYTYSGASTPAIGIIARTATGIYVAQVDTTTLPGYWEYEWVSTGTGQSSGTGSFNVAPLPF